MVFMNNSLCKSILLPAMMLLSSVMVMAQNLPVLTPDKAIKTGTLPNGTSYYIVSNPTIKGLADFALVQKTGVSNIADTSSAQVVSAACGALSVLPRTSGRPVQDFFASHGAIPGKDGFVKVTDNATQFHFHDVIISKPEVLDSALLVLMDMVDRVSRADDGFISRWYAPADQAIVVAGDVDAASVAEKMKMISYMIPPVPSAPRKEYVWEQKDSASYICAPQVHDGIATFTAVWNLTRTPRAYMNTVQPAIYDLFLTELGMVVEEYVKTGLRQYRIPYAEVKCGHVTSMQSSGDESFSVTVSVAEDEFPYAVGVVAEVLGRVDFGYTDISDLARMKRTCLDDMKLQVLRPMFNNSEYVDRCATSFLHNGSLATLKTKVDFLAGRVLADTTELRLFNNISSAILDPEKNLTVTYSASMPEEQVKNAFSNAWAFAKDFKDDTKRYTAADVEPLELENMKVKVVEKTDHMSNGLEWTFPSGFKIVYKRLPAGGKMYFNLALNGGYSAIDNLAKGEGGYVSDYFKLTRIDGMPAEDFMKVIAAAGMSLDVYTGLNTTMISGSADEGDLDFMMSSLLIALYERRKDDEAVKYYESCEPLRSALRAGGADEMTAKINDIMCPDYKYVSYKMAERLSPELADKAMNFYDTILKKTNDGVLILVGNLDPSVLKKKISPYVDCFETSDVAFRKPLVRYQPASGWSTYTVEGERNSIDVAMSVPLALTADNFMAAEIAAMVLNKNLSKALTGTGMYLTLSHECRVYPNERLNLHLALNEVSEDGFSTETINAGAMGALAVVRKVLSGADGMDVSSEDVEVFKLRLKAAMEQEMKDPYYWMNVISRRHLAGKDFTTNYQARIKTVTVDKVKSILSKLEEGSKVEYIVISK